MSESFTVTATKLRRFHLDFHVLLTLAQRGWSILAGGVMVVLVPKFFTQVEQGYYYTFLSLLALQVFFELGFNVVIVQLVGHEAAHLSFRADGSVEGDPSHVNRLNSLLGLLHRWYLTAASSFFVGVSAAGYYFFQKKGGLPAGTWLGVWISLVLFTSVNLYLSPLLAVLEGIGKVGQVARLRLLQSVVGYTLLWLALAFNAGLRAVPVVTATAAIGSLLWLRRHRAFLHPPRRPVAADGAGMRWQTEIFPMQWRIAVSWVSGYFIFQAFTPLIFAHQGAVEAGRVGIALAIFSSLSTLGMSWLNASAPKFVRLIARDERAELNRMFIAVMRSSLAFTVLSSLALVAAVVVLQRMGNPIAVRIASLPVLACLAVVNVANGFIFGAATYMRAHKAEPMLPASVACGLLTLAAAYFGSQVSALAAIGFYAATTLLVGLPWTAMLLHSFYRRGTVQS